MKHLAGLRVSQAQHQRLAALCSGDVAFPKTFDAWLRAMREAEDEAQQSNAAMRPIEIDVERFVDWCALVGIVPCIDALKAYVIVQRLDPGERLPAVASPTPGAGQR